MTQTQKSTIKYHLPALTKHHLILQLAAVENLKICPVFNFKPCLKFTAPTSKGTEV